MFAVVRNRFVLGPTLFSCLRHAKHTLASTELQQTKLILEKNGFSENQTETLLTNLSEYMHKDSPQLVNSSLQCWRKHLRPKKGDILKNDELFYDVFLTNEPRLLLLKSDFILQRIDMLKSLDLVRGNNDLWTLFLKAPSGYYLQDWKEFLRKYYYITYKILPWLESEIENDAINPILKCPAVIELTFNVIKTRFIFAQRTGNKGSSCQNERQVNLNTLLKCPIKEFLEMYSPLVTAEEFLALEKLNASSAGEEDDKLFEDLVDLAPKDAPRKSFINDNLKEIYLLSDIKH